MKSKLADLLAWRIDNLIRCEYTLIKWASMIWLNENMNIELRIKLKETLMDLFNERMTIIITFLF
jgi:hypothetical protein